MITDLAEVWAVVKFRDVQPFENNVGVESNVLPVLLPHETSQNARATRTAGSLKRFLMSLLPSQCGLKLHRERDSPFEELQVPHFALRGSEVAQRDVEGDNAVGAAPIAWNRPVFRIVLLRGGLVLVRAMDNKPKLSLQFGAVSQLESAASLLQGLQSTSAPSEVC